MADPGPAAEPGPSRQSLVAPEAVWAYEADLERLARLLCRHREDAEDVAHAALVKAVEHLGGFRSEATLRTWLHRIASNECAMLRRRRPPASLDEITSSGRSAHGRGLAVTEDPEATALDAAERRAVLGAVGRLPPRERLVLLLTVGERLPADEVARRAGLSVPAVRALLYRARRRVREEAGLGDPGEKRS